jgi:hypothetical protein
MLPHCRNVTPFQLSTGLYFESTFHELGKLTVVHGSTPCATTYTAWSLRTAVMRRMRTVSPCRRPLFPLLAQYQEMPPLCGT